MKFGGFFVEERVGYFVLSFVLGGLLMGLWVFLVSYW